MLEKYNFFSSFEVMNIRGFMRIKGYICRNGIMEVWAMWNLRFAKACLRVVMYHAKSN